MVDQAKTTLGAVYLRELDSEAKATRECLANHQFDYQSHGPSPWPTVRLSTNEQRTIAIDLRAFG